MSAGRLATTLLLLAALGLAAGCGRRGDLDTPYQAGLDAREEAKDNDEPLPPAPKKPAEDRRFFLDGLI